MAGTKTGFKTLDIQEAAKNLGCQILILKNDLFDDKTITACIKQNIAVSVFTVNDAEEANNYIQMGAASVITDTSQKLAMYNILLK